MNQIKSAFRLLHAYAYQIKLAIDQKNLELSTFSYFFQYYRDNIKNRFSHVNQEIPWITYSAVKKLKKILHKDMKVFEFGSGGSTLFYAKAVGEVISVEHDESWYLQLKKIISDREVNNIKLIRSLPTQISELQIGTNPYTSVQKKEYAGMAFNNYVSEIDTFKDDYFDVIIIDGRARPYCLKHSIKKLKPGGYIVYDNFERKSYHDEVFESIQSWKIHSSYQPVVGCRYFSNTGIFKKPL